MNDLAITDACVLFALGREAGPFLREFRPHLRVPDAPCWVRFCGPSWLPVLVLRTGAGADRMERALEWLLEPAIFDAMPIRPKIVLSAGFAGALDPDRRVGDVILASEVVDETGKVWVTTWPESLPGGEWNPPLHRGRLLTVGRVVGDPAEKRRLGEQHQAIAVDMESAVVARWCQRQGIPFGCVRAISDEASTALSGRLAALLSGGEVRWWNVILPVLRSPGLLAEFWPLARHSRLAARQLGKALGELLTLSTPWGDDVESQ